MRIGLGIGIPQFQGNGSSGIASSINFAQLVTGDVPSGWTFTRSTSGTYFDASGVLQLASTNVLRISRDPVSGELGYVGEPGRTNRLTYSEDLPNAAWTKNRGSISANSAVALDGATTGDKLVEDGTTGQHFVSEPYTFSAIAYTASAFFKAGERTVAVISQALFRANFDLATGTVSETSGSPTSTAIENCGNGWYRCSMTFTAVAAASTLAFGMCNATTGFSYAGNGTSGLYIWGTQLEDGPYPTSYIPTTTVAVSRGADLLTTTLSAAHAAALSVAGTMVARFSFLGGGATASAAATRRVCTISNSDTSSRHYVTNNGSGGLTAYTVTSTSQQASPAAGSGLGVSSPVKVAHTWSADSCQVSVDGSNGTRDEATPSGMPTIDRVAVGGNISAGAELAGLVHSFAIYTAHYPTDAGLNALTV